MEKRGSLIIVLIALMMLVTVVSVINIALLLGKLSVVDSRVNNLQRQLTAQTTIKGEIGPTGVDGIPGVSIEGQQGISGESGNTGATGEKGDQGQKGDVGAKGATGDKGTPGESIDIRWNQCLDNGLSIPVLEKKRTSDDFWSAVSDSTSVADTCQVWLLPAQ